MTLAWSQMDKFTWEASVMPGVYYIEVRWDPHGDLAWFWQFYHYREAEDDFDCGEWIELAYETGFTDQDAVSASAEAYISDEFITNLIYEEEEPWLHEAA